MPVTIFQSLVPGVDKLTLDEGTGSLGPRLIAASCWRINSIHINFNRNMLVNLPEGLVGDNASYLIFETANPSVVLPVIRVVTFRTAPTAAEIFVHGMVQDAQYTIEVIADALDIYGTPIDHDYDSYSFLGMAHQVPAPGGLSLFIGLEAGVQKLDETDWRPDLEPPYLLNQLPAPDDRNIPTTTTLEFDVLDEDSGVNTNRTSFWVDGNAIYTYGVIVAAGWSVIRTPIADGYNYQFSHATPFADGATVTLRVYAEDLAYSPNVVDESWVFETLFLPGIREEEIQTQQQTCWDFPIRFGERGGVSLTTSKHSIENNMKTSVMIHYGGIPLRAALGSRMHLIPHDPSDGSTQDAIGSEISRSIAVGEPRAIVDPAVIFARDENTGEIKATVAYATRKERKWDSIELDIPSVETVDKG